MEAHAFGFQPQTLLERRLAAQADFAACAEHAVPGQPVSALPQQLHHQAVMQRVACGGSHGGIGGHAPARDAADDVKDRLVARFIPAPQSAAQRAFQARTQALHTPQQ